MSAAKFWTKVDRSGSCWLWVGPLKKDGYGIAAFDGRTRQVHRVAYELAVGSIPAKFTVDHLCRVRNCVRPEHLELVNGAENTRRAQEANGTGQYATHCPQGHPYDEVNTYVDKRGFRYCKTCQRQRTREWRERRRGGPARPYGPAVTACPQGHPYDEANTGRRADGRRRCRACDAERARRQRQAVAA